MQHWQKHTRFHLMSNNHKFSIKRKPRMDLFARYSYTLLNYAIVEEKETEKREETHLK